LHSGRRPDDADDSHAVTFGSGSRVSPRLQAVSRGCPSFERSDTKAEDAIKIA
jgi:hypothetical protein